MPEIIRVTDINTRELDVYVRLTGAQLRHSVEEEQGIFIAESPTVIEVALGAGCVPVSLLTDERLIKNGSVLRAVKMCENATRDSERPFPVYTAERELLTAITGFELTRGALCAMLRPTPTPLEELLRGARRIAVLEGVTDSTNIGALFRSAAALNMDAVLLTPTCCDPLCRRAVRVSMGTVFQVPWGKICEGEGEWRENGVKILQSYGFKCAAMALTDESVSIDYPPLMSEERLAVILGTEGTGLIKETIAAADYTVKIPMSHGVDSLNVAAAGAVAFWQLGKRS